jgi:DNA-binding transcriptional LysR family regulator
MVNNWDDIRIFLAVARNSGLNSAAKALRINHTTVARRLTGLEKQIGTRLVIRSPAGISLTSAGQELIAHAERIEAEAIAVSDSVKQKDDEVAGKVRLATREAFGTWVVCPKANILSERYPDLTLELVPEPRTVSLLKRDADLAVTMTYPSQDRLVFQKLTDYRLGLFASRQYLDKTGPVTKIEDLRGRPLIWYVGEMIDVPELRYLDNILANAYAVFRSTTMISQQVATASGVGFGILPLFSTRLEPNLVQVLPGEVEVTRSYWLTVHPDARKLPRIRAVIDFLVEVVRENKPYF